MKLPERIAIIDGIRTPFCKAGGTFNDVPADALGVRVVQEVLARTDLPPESIDELIMGNVAGPADCMNIARVIALKAGLPTGLIAHSVQRNCASGMQSVTSAAMQILTGESRVLIAGGTESMSNIPLLYNRAMTELFGRLFKARTTAQKLRALMGFRPGHLKPVVGVLQGLTDPVCGLNMGQTAEVLAREFHVTRAEQDAYALRSHQRATAATESGFLPGEIVPVPVPPRYSHVQAVDDGPRAQQSMEQLQKLRPFFDRHTGTVTVGNACPITDGAAAMVLAGEAHVRDMGLKPLGYLSAFAYAALGPDRMGLGPVYATARLLRETGLAMSDFERVELNEAFAAQVLANLRAFESATFARSHLGQDAAVGAIDLERLNVNGGAIALGHPVGTSGTRLILTLLRQLREAGLHRGLATLCIGGGQGAALVLEVE